MKKAIKHTLALAALALISACGGGGGDDNPSNSNASIPDPIPPTQISIRTAWRNVLRTGGSWQVTGADSAGNQYLQTVVISAGQDKTYSDYGVIQGPFYTATVSSTTLKNGQNIGSKTQELFVTKDSYEVKFGRTPGYCFLSTTSFPLPAVATLNSGGTLFSANKLSQCTNLGFDGTISASWSYEADRGVPLLCIKIEFENTCIEVDNQGSLGRKMRLTTTGLTLKNY